MLRGTLRTGDALVAGANWGRVRAMHDFMGNRLKQATPGEPVEVLGFDSLPDAGEPVRAVSNDREARHLANERAIRLKTEALARRMGVPVSLENVFEKVQEGQAVQLNLVIKADVAGLARGAPGPDREAFDHRGRAQRAAHGRGRNLELRRDAGAGLRRGDHRLQRAAAARTPTLLADQEGVEIRTYTVIYKVTEELRAAMEGMLEPEEVEESLGMAEVRQTFRASRIGTIAGCHVVQGKITRNASIRLVREGTIVYDGALASLKRFKDDVREVEEGFECGIVLENFQDIKEGDVLEAYETRKVARELELGEQARLRGASLMPCPSWSRSPSICTSPTTGA